MPLLLLLLAAFTLYGKALGHDFLGNWDDPAYVTGNPDSFIPFVPGNEWSLSHNGST